MALPEDFIKRTKTLLGNEFEALQAALAEDAPVSIRLNNDKKNIVAPSDYEPIEWSSAGYYLPERLSFTFDPLFHAGAYYVQEASSMFVEQAIRQHAGNAPIRCLDLCAAPGGKSTLLLQTLPEGSLLVSNEVIKSRSNILAENLAKWGNPNKVVCNNDPKQIGKLTHLFDIIVADVPCSGEGMFRKDTDSTGEWSVGNVDLCAGRQRRIISDIWEALKPGGLLIYSTCTYNTEENEDNIKFIVEELGAEALPVEAEPRWKITGALKYSNPVYRFLPHKTKGEGFFLAVLRKDDDTIKNLKQKGRKDQKKPATPIPPLAKSVLVGSDNAFEWNGNYLHSLPESVSSVYGVLKDNLYLLSAGICIGELKGKDLIPSQELALANNLNKEAFPTYEADWETAIKFLKKETMTLPMEIEKGYVLLTYKGYNLGFVKNIGNRANNLYPQEWRIRSGYIPEKVTTLPI